MIHCRTVFLGWICTVQTDPARHIVTAAYDLEMVYFERQIDCDMPEVCQRFCRRDLTVMSCEEREAAFVAGCRLRYRAKPPAVSGEARGRAGAAATPISMNE